MPWIKGGLLPSTLAPEWAEARSKRPRSGLGASAPGYVEAGHEFGPGGRHQSSTTLFARSISYEPADMEERPSPRPLWDRSSSLDSLRPQTSLGLQTLPSLAQRRLPVGPGLRTVADRPRSGNARAPLESQIPRASRQITVKRTRTLPDLLGEADESAGEEKENEHGRARVDWRDEPRGHIQQLVHEGFLDICSKLTLEYEIDGSVDLSYERFKNSHEYDEKYKRIEYNFRRGLEQASASLCYSDQPFSAEDHAIPMSKWCHFECKRNGRPGDFEVVLVVQKAGQLEKRRVRIYSRSERGKYPNATSIMDFLASVLPRVRAANPTVEEAASAADEAPRSALAIIAASQAEDRRRRAEQLNSSKILEIREEQRRQIALKRVIGRMFHRALSGAYRRWSDTIEERKAQLSEEERRQQLMKRILSKMFQKTLSTALECWCERVHERKAELSEEERKQLLLRRILSKMFNKALSGAFERWCEEIEERKAEEARKQALMKRITMRMMNKCLCTCLDAWAEHVREEVEKRARMKRIVGRMLGKCLSVAFERWCFYIDAIQHERATGDEEERKQALLKRVVMRITHKTLSTCLLVWAEYTIAEVDKRTRMRRIILRMTGNLLGRMYANWRQHIQNLREEEAEEERRQGVVERVLKRIINRTLSNGFLVWYETVVDIKEERVLQAQEAVEAAKRALEAELDSTKKQATQRAATLELELANAKRALQEKEGQTKEESKACIIS